MIEALEEVRRLNKELQIKAECIEFPQEEELNHDIWLESKDAKNLRKQLKEELLAIIEKVDKKYVVPEVIKNSEVYAKVREYIIEGRHISDENPMWGEIEDIVHKNSPHFRNRLELLTGSKIRTADHQIALLVKLGITPTEMTILLSRTKGTISYRREALGERMLDEKMGVKVVDDIIRVI